MPLLFLIFSLSCHHVLQLALADEITLTRHANADVFTIPGSCNQACMVLSSDTASPYGSISISGYPNDSCMCQCNYELPIFREDLGICVDNIQECDVAGFVGSSGLVEKVPYVFLPQYGQIIYPQAEIQFEGVKSPVCVITGVQQLGRSGWSDLRNVSDVEFPLSLYRDEERSFLQWTGEAKLREAAEGKIVVVKLACRDSHPSTVYRGVFTPCVAFRVAGSPSRAAIKEVLFSTSPPKPQGLSSSEYTAIGISSVLLALIYIASVSLYLHSRKSRRKDNEEHAPETGNCLVDVEAPAHVKCNPLLSVSRHFESDTNSAISEADLADKLLHSESEAEIENVTSAVVHPYEECSEPQEQSNSSGPIIGERLPEEDVRVIETTEHGNQHHMPVFPGSQRRKLYFNPAYFEKQLLAAPPPAAVEFLLKIREVISIAKHKMAAKRFVPTLNEIPEESSSSERQSIAAAKAHKKRASSVQNGVSGLTKLDRKSLRCPGCSGCSNGSSTPSLPTALNLAENSAGIAPISGESRVRAWLEDVKLLDMRWRNLEEERNFTKRYFNRINKMVKAKETKDLELECTRMSTKSLPPIFNQMPEIDFNGCLNDTFVNDEAHGRAKSKRSVRSVTHEPGHFDRQADEVTEWTNRNSCYHEENVVNANIRRAIESSFRKQLDQLHTAKLSEKPSSKSIVAAQSSSEKSARCSSYENVQVRTAAINNAKQNSDLSIKEDISKQQPKKVRQFIEEPAEASETRVLLDIINDELSSRSTNKAKRIMDAVIQELVVAKEKEKESQTSKTSDYETDSLEKTKISRKSWSSADSTEKSSPAQSTALPMDEELTMRNAIIDVQISETTSNLINNHNLPEVVPLRSENYALVSEVYVNDGYASPTGSDDESGPEIQYEPENPGHLTIKVMDSPTNYVRHDESDYEPDTLDRKPMKLKINDNVIYEKDVNEVFVDSLERSSQILLKSKRSFNEANDIDANSKLPQEYNSLREIFEARLKHQQQRENKQSQLKLQERELPQQEKTREHPQEKSSAQRQTENKKSSRDGKRETEKNCRNDACSCASPLLPRQERRQRKADNQPDVVPKPPPPPPPPEPPSLDQIAKNVQDRSFAEAGDPTTRKDAPVIQMQCVPVVGKPPAVSQKPNVAGDSNAENSVEFESHKAAKKDKESERLGTSALTNVDNKKKNEKRQQYRSSLKWRGATNEESRNSRSSNRRSKSQKRSDRSRSRSSEAPNFEDSAYVSSPDSSNSRRKMLLTAEDFLQQQLHSSCTESDESTSGNGANSESGAESIETDSVFFGNFRARAERERLALEAGCHHRDKAAKQQQQSSSNYTTFNANSIVH
ncbi:uncharacterized protein LOC131673066 [Phymastichus coffea]|uniref:uncharacterized protein LOC131673066 n=1 Tax=Phymastichus coffea TaxID=108790 RepID=UPI00273B1C68|nr:uncharacterized protein LOC131673066 [Phymastichus coffea]